MKLTQELYPLVRNTDPMNEDQLFAMTANLLKLSHTIKLSGRDDVSTFICKFALSTYVYHCAMSDLRRNPMIGGVKQEGYLDELGEDDSDSDDDAASYASGVVIANRILRYTDERLEEGREAVPYEISADIPGENIGDVGQGQVTIRAPSAELLTQPMDDEDLAIFEEALQLRRQMMRSELTKMKRTMARESVMDEARDEFAKGQLRAIQGKLQSGAMMRMGGPSFAIGLAAGLSQMLYVESMYRIGEGVVAAGEGVVNIVQQAAPGPVEVVRAVADIGNDVFGGIAWLAKKGWGAGKELVGLQEPVIKKPLGILGNVTSLPGPIPIDMRKPISETLAELTPRSLTSTTVMVALTATLATGIVAYISEQKRSSLLREKLIAGDIMANEDRLKQERLDSMFRAGRQIVGAGIGLVVPAAAPFIAAGEAILSHPVTERPDRQRNDNPMQNQSMRRSQPMLQLPPDPVEQTGLRQRRPNGQSGRGKTKKRRKTKRRRKTRHTTKRRRSTK